MTDNSTMDHLEHHSARETVLVDALRRIVRQTTGDKPPAVIAGEALDALRLLDEPDAFGPTYRLLLTREYGLDRIGND